MPTIGRVPGGQQVRRVQGKQLGRVPGTNNWEGFKGDTIRRQGIQEAKKQDWFRVLTIERVSREITI